MSTRTAVALVLALASATLVGLAYLREHDAAASLPALSLRRPLQSLRLLLRDRSWLVGFAMETGGWLLYVAALALASLALVQTVSAGSIGLLAFASARLSGRSLRPRERWGAAVSVLGLALLGVSLAAGSGSGGRGSVVALLIWIAASAGLAAVVRTAGLRVLPAATADGIAGGLLLSAGDLSTKVATEGGARTAFIPVVIVGYVLGSALVQLGYQRGEALAVAGIATLLTDALPILAGTFLLGEGIPAGTLGALRILAFLTVIVGAVTLVRPEG